MNRNALFAITLVIGLFAINWFNNNDKDTMPSIAFNDIEQQSHSFDQYKGKPILVIFWATDCPGCIMELPELIAMHDTYAKQGLTMIGIAMSHDSTEHIKAMRDKEQIPYTITWDESGELAQAFNNVRVTPTHFLIDPEGEIVMRRIGALNPIRIEALLHNMGLTAP